MLDRLYECFEKIICLILSIIGGLVILINVLVQVDFTPATFDDYAPLNEILLQVEETPEIMLQREGTIIISEDKIVYTVENEQCRLTGKYSKDYKLQSKEQEDKALTIFKSIIAFTLLFALIVVFEYIVLLLMTYLIWYIILLITYKNE